MYYSWETDCSGTFKQHVTKVTAFIVCWTMVYFNTLAWYVDMKWYFRDKTHPSYVTGIMDITCCNYDVTGCNIQATHDKYGSLFKNAYISNISNQIKRNISAV